MKKIVRVIISVLLAMSFTFVLTTNTFAQAQSKNKTNWSMIAAGGNGGQFYLALKSDGTVWAWGNNQAGQLGIGTQDVYQTQPVKIPSLENVVYVEAGSNHGGAVKADGTVWTWGNNEYGQLGNGNKGEGSWTNIYTYETAPVKVVGLSDVKAIALGTNHSLALKKDGTVWAWGSNTSGKLGDGTQEQAVTPVQVSGLTDVVSIDAALEYSAAIKSDGSLWTWGSFGGRLGTPAGPVNLVPAKFEGLSHITAIAANTTYMLALKSDGTVWGWGTNDYGSMCKPGVGDWVATPARIPGLSNIVSISSANTNIAVKKNGTIWSWGFGCWGQDYVEDKSAQKPTKLKGIKNVLQACCGGSYVVLSEKDGGLYGVTINVNESLATSFSKDPNLVEFAVPSSDTKCPKKSSCECKCSKAN